MEQVGGTRTRSHACLAVDSLVSATATSFRSTWTGRFAWAVERCQRIFHAVHLELHADRACGWASIDALSLLLLLLPPRSRSAPAACAARHARALRRRLQESLVAVACSQELSVGVAWTLPLLALSTNLAHSPAFPIESSSTARATDTPQPAEHPRATTAESRPTR
ncbi:hypothetical protein AAT19DRAFT_9418 [Rhodotorula toruloides]|uniref:Uncharacterized protein n=1 Tax=Rhodotorula toruloides TaxID=5286 RepID=A0A2T0A246_RHOTO|nr:hypothetical protein AAT19DRAFT_9418 [Rhodotorula toruloides]